MRQSSDFYLKVADKQNSLLDQLRKTGSSSNIYLPTLDTSKQESENPYQNMSNGNQNSKIDLSIEEDKPLESHYDTRKILGETRYHHNIKNSISNRQHCKHFDLVIIILSDLTSFCSSASTTMTHLSIAFSKDSLCSIPKSTDPKIKVMPSCLQKRDDQIIIALTKNCNEKREIFNDLDCEYQSHKAKLEEVKLKHDDFMAEIQNWSSNRRQLEQKAFLENELDTVLVQKSQLKHDLKDIEHRYESESNMIISELDQLKEEIIEKKRISKAFKIQEELVNLKINPMKQELTELYDSKSAFEENITQIEEVHQQ